MDEQLENTGGDGGGVKEPLVLKRSELALLRRMADRFPFTDGERVEVVDNVMDVLRTSRSRRHRIAAAKTVAALEKVNLDELKTCLASKDKPAMVAIQNNISPVLVIEVEKDHASHNGTGTNGTPLPS